MNWSRFKIPGRVNHGSERPPRKSMDESKNWKRLGGTELSVSYSPCVQSTQQEAREEARLLAHNLRGYLPSSPEWKASLSKTHSQGSMRKQGIAGAKDPQWSLPMIHICVLKVPQCSQTASSLGCSRAQVYEGHFTFRPQQAINIWRTQRSSAL